MMQPDAGAAMMPPLWPRNAPPAASDFGDADRDDRRPVVHVFRPCRAATQSGRAREDEWVLEFDSADPQRIEPLMGWTSARDPRQSLRLRFPSRESAAAFARRRGWRVVARLPQQRRLRPKSYADRFRMAVPQAGRSVCVP